MAQCSPVVIRTSTPPVVIRTNPQGPPGPSGAIFNFREEKFVPTTGQITFILAFAPSDIDSVVFTVNGTDYINGAGDSFTVSGTTVTWLDTPFTMSASPQDEVHIRYVV